MRDIPVLSSTTTDPLIYHNRPPPTSDDAREVSSDFDAVIQEGATAMNEIFPRDLPASNRPRWRREDGSGLPAAPQAGIGYVVTQLDTHALSL